MATPDDEIALEIFARTPRENRKVAVALFRAKDVHAAPELWIPLQWDADAMIGHGHYEPNEDGLMLSPAVVVRASVKAGVGSRRESKASACKCIPHFEQVLPAKALEKVAELYLEGPRIMIYVTGNFGIREDPSSQSVRKLDQCPFKVRKRFPETTLFADAK